MFRGVKSSVYYVHFVCIALVTYITYYTVLFRNLYYIEHFSEELFSPWCWPPLWALVLGPSCVTNLRTINTAKTEFQIAGACKNATPTTAGTAQGPRALGPPSP